MTTNPGIGGNVLQQYLSTLLNGGVDNYQEIYNTNARFVSIVLASGAYYDIEEGHTFFRVESGVNIFVNFNKKKPDVQYPAGTGYSYPDYAPIRNLRVYNGDAGAQTVTFYYGSGSFLDTRVTLAGSLSVNILTNAPSNQTFSTAVDFSCAAGANTSIISPASTARYTVILTNLDPAITIRVGPSVGGATATRGIPLRPNEKMFLDTGSGINVFNPGGTAVTLSYASIST